MGRVLSKDGNILVSTVVHILANIIDTATSLHASILKVTIVFIGKIYYCSVIRPKHNAVSYSAINNTVIPVSFGIPSSRQIDNNTYVFAIERLQNVLIYLNLSFNKVSLGFNIPGNDSFSIDASCEAVFTTADTGCTTIEINMANATRKEIVLFRIDYPSFRQHDPIRLSPLWH